MKVYCELYVEGGIVLNFLCLNYDCKLRILLEIFWEVFDVEKFEWWERLLFSKILDIMGDIVYCLWCNLVVVIDEDEIFRFVYCVNCYFVFCIECY